MVKLFSGGQPDEKAKIVNLCQKIDPGNGVKYQRINQTQ
ncbi:MAG: hypothetical protein ACRCYO_18115 [Bacteroidia bacterium]